MQGSQLVYEYHNTERRGKNATLLKATRTKLFRDKIGVGKSILDLGCRDGALTKSFMEGNDVLGVDIDSVSLARASEAGIKTLQADLNSDWNVITGKYDVVCLAETLEHLYYPEKVIEKVLPLLKTDGMFIGSVPNAFNLKNRVRLLLGNKKATTLSDPTHINHFKHNELKQLLQKYFSTVEVIPLGVYSWLDWVMPGMFSYDLMFICKHKQELAKI